MANRFSSEQWRLILSQEGEDWAELRRDAARKALGRFGIRKRARAVNRNSIQRLGRQIGHACPRLRKSLAVDQIQWASGPRFPPSPISLFGRALGFCETNCLSRAARRAGNSSEGNCCLARIRFSSRWVSI
jgi:hypothetical protein